MEGKLIAIMGIDGSGKTTLVRNLQKCGCGIENWKCLSIFDNSIFTEELEMVAGQQGKTRRQCFSKELRSITWKADLINNVFKYVIPELEKGSTVILDRYTLCNKVYSSLEKSGLGYMDKILEVLPSPDLGIYLDVDIDVAIRRINKRTGKERAPYEKKDGLIDLERKYKKLMSQEGYPIVKINANLSEKEVTRSALDAIIRVINRDKGKDMYER